MSYNFLVVDDSKTARLMLAKSINLSGLPVGEVHMAENGRGCTAQGKPFPRDFRIGGNVWQLQTRYDPRADHTFADIDNDDAQRERESLCSQRVRAAGVTAAHRANVNTALEPADNQRAHQRADEITDQKLDTEFEHCRRLTFA